MSARRLCRFDDLSDPGSRGFAVERPGQPPLRVFVVRSGDRAYAYRNSCPHTGATMEWQADQFLDYELSYIQCGIHGALFRIADGYCVHGPCAGRFLQALPLKDVDGVLWLEEPEDGQP